MHDMIAYKGQQSKDHTFRGSIRRLSQAYRQGSPTVRHCLSRPRRTPPRHVAPVAQGHAAPPKAQTKSSSRDARNGFRLPSVPIRQMCCNAHASTIRGEVLTALGLGPSPTEFFFPPRLSPPLPLQRSLLRCLSSHLPPVRARACTGCQRPSRKLRSLKPTRAVDPTSTSRYL